MTKLLKVSEVAEIVREHPVTVYRRIKAGEIKAISVGKRGIRVAESELARWIGVEQENSASGSAKKGQ